jgi:MoxR-like ATPase
MKKEISHWSTVLDIIEAALTRDPEKVRNYSALLAEHLDEAGEKSVAARIRRILDSRPMSRAVNGGNSSVLSPAQTAFAPVDPESRSPFVDEILLDSIEAPILGPSKYAEISRFIRLQSHADSFVREGIPTPRSLLLYGPPGCGKSTTAKFVAKELGLPLFTVRLDAVMSSFLGTTAKNLRAVFEHAARRAAVLLIDEFDALAKMRDDANEVGELKRIVNSLIQNMDMFPRLYVIAATNHEHLLDPAIWRRFDVVSQLTLPGSDERMALLRQFLKSEEIAASDLHWVVLMTEGCSGSDLEQMAVRSRQEKVLAPETPLIQLLVREVWSHIDGEKSAFDRESEGRTGLVRFIDSRTGKKIPAKTMEALTGISDSTVARIRRLKGDVTIHG